MRIKITLHTPGRTRLPVQLPDDRLIGHLTPALVRKMDLPTTDDGDDLLTYHLVHYQTGERLDDGLTLAEADIRDGAHLTLDVDVRELDQISVIPRSRRRRTRLDKLILMVWGLAILLLIATFLTLLFMPFARGVIPTISNITPLTFDVVDAGYCHELNRIIMISDDPNQLHIIDPVTKVDEVVGLSYPPISLSVGPNGQLAAVGHDRKVSYVNLAKGLVIREYDIPIPAYQIILADVGWIYIFTGELSEIDNPSAWGLNVETGELATGEGTVSEGLFYKIHPSGDMIYFSKETGIVSIKRGS